MVVVVDDISNGKSLLMDLRNPCQAFSTLFNFAIVCCCTNDGADREDDDADVAVVVGSNPFLKIATNCFSTAPCSVLLRTENPIGSKYP